MKAWQDLEKTIPCEKNGDPIACLEPGTIEFDLTQPDESKRPTFEIPKEREGKG